MAPRRPNGIHPTRRNLLVEPERPPGACPEWAVCCQEFLTAQRLASRSPRTVELHRENLRIVEQDLVRYGLPLDVPRLDARMLGRLVLGWQDAGRSPRTINLRLQTLRQFFRYLVSAGWIATDPTATLPRQRERKGLPKSLTEAEIQRLLAAPDRKTFAGLRDYAMILLMLDTGMRLGEVLAMRVDQIDWEHQVIHIPHAKDRQERQVYFSQKTAACLRRYAAERGVVAAREFFISRDGRPLQPRSFQENLERHAARAGVRVTAHGLRHTFARLWVVGGGDAFSLAQMLGHEDMSTVAIYVRLWGSDVKAMHARFSPVSRLVLA